MSMYEQRDRLMYLINRNTDKFRRAKDEWRYDSYRYPHPRSPEIHTLSPLLGEGVSLQNLVNARKSEGKTTHVLELFGSAEFLHDPSTADSLTGIRLADVCYPNDPDSYRPRPPHHKVIPGDLYDLETTWSGLLSNMRNRNIPSQDFIVYAPVGASSELDFLEIEEFPINVFLSIYYPMLENAYSILSPDGGTLFAEIPHGIYPSKKALALWQKRMNRAGIPTEVVSEKAGPERNDLIQITRNSDSPAGIVPLLPHCRMPKE